MLRNIIGANVYAPLFTYLNNSDFLQLRRLEKKLCHDIGAIIPTPYSNIQNFIIANTGIYRTKRVVKNAWTVYIKSLLSGSSFPAVLYALDEIGVLYSSVFPQINFGEDLINTGRMYYPPQRHSWDVNAAWVLAQIHKGRQFCLISDYPGDNHAYRKGGDYSALTKEITLALMSGYKVTGTYLLLNRNIIMLSPPEETKRVNSLRFFVITHNVCDHTINYMNNLQLKINVGINIAEKINKIFNSFDLIQKDLVYLKKISSMLSLLFAKIDCRASESGFLNVFDQAIIYPNSEKKTGDMGRVKRLLINKIKREIKWQKSRKVSSLGNLSFLNQRSGINSGINNAKACNPADKPRNVSALQYPRSTNV